MYKLKLSFCVFCVYLLSILSMCSVIHSPNQHKGHGFLKILGPSLVTGRLPIPRTMRNILLSESLVCV